MFLIVTLVNVSIWRFYVIAYDIKQIKEHENKIIFDTTRVKNIKIYE